MSDHPDGIAEMSYRDGEHPIDHAIWRLAQIVEVADTVRTARQVNPAAFPVYVMGTDPTTTGRRLVGLMLELGWTPPEVGRAEAGQ